MFWRKKSCTQVDRSILNVFTIKSEATSSSRIKKKKEEKKERSVWRVLLSTYDIKYRVGSKKGTGVKKRRLIYRVVSHILQGVQPSFQIFNDDIISMNLKYIFFAAILWKA